MSVGGPAQRIADACLAIKDQVFEPLASLSRRWSGREASWMTSWLLALDLLAVLQKEGEAETRRSARLHSGVGGVSGVVDVRGRGGRGADEQPRRAGATLGGVVVPEELLWVSSRFLAVGSSQAAVDRRADITAATASRPPVPERDAHRSPRRPSHAKVDAGRVNGYRRGIKRIFGGQHGPVIGAPRPRRSWR